MIDNPSPNRKINITYVKSRTRSEYINDPVGAEFIIKGFCTYDAHKNPIYHDQYGNKIKKEHVIEWSYLKS